MWLNVWLSRTSWHHAEALSYGKHIIQHWRPEIVGVYQTTCVAVQIRVAHAGAALAPHDRVCIEFVHVGDSVPAGESDARLLWQRCTITHCTPLVVRREMSIAHE